MHAVHDRAVRRVERGVVGHRDQLLDGHVLRVVVAALVPRFWNALSPALLKEWKERVWPTEQQDLVPECVAASQNGQVLHHDGVRKRAHDLVGRDACLHEIDNVGLGKDPALGRYVVEMRVIEVEGQRLFGRHADLDHALVDGGAGARGAFVVHRRDGRLVARLLVLLEDDDLRILATELDDRPRIGVQRLDG